MKDYVIVIAAAIMACTLMGGRINVNLQHNMHLPKELTNKTTIITNTSLFGVSKSDVYLSDIMMSKFLLRDTIELLDQAKKGDEITFHIAGDGGEVDTVLMLVNHVKTTKAHTTMIVEAPSYSGHAFLALSGDELILDRFTYLMMHTSSAMDQDCSQETGVDRGETNEETCNIMKKAGLDTVNDLLMVNKYLTIQQKTDIIAGKTVIIRAQ